MEKYDINNFFVGELYLSYNVDGLLSVDTIGKHSKEFNKISDMYKTSAIKFQKTLLRRYKNYEGFLTVFYKVLDKYMCLHNGVLYELKGIDFCDNLISLSELLPKLSYSIPKKISINEAICIFNSLFKNKKGIKLNNSKYDINDFYVGNLILHEGILPNNNRYNRYQYISLARQYILYNNGASIGSMFGKEDVFTNLHDFSSFKSLFLRYPRGIYNLHSYQFYDKGILDKKHMDSNNIYDDYYEWMEPLETVLNENKINCNSQSISIPKALNLYKKINR